MLGMALKEHSIFEWLSQEIYNIKRRINLLKLKNALLMFIMHEMLAEVNMLSTITATNCALAPINASLIVSKIGVGPFCLKPRLSRNLRRKMTS